MSTTHSFTVADTVDAPQGLANFNLADEAIQRFRALCAQGVEADEAQRSAAVDTTMARTPAPIDRPGMTVSDVSADAVTVDGHEPGTTWEPAPAEPWTPEQRHTDEEPLDPDDRVSLTDAGEAALDATQPDTEPEAEPEPDEVSRRIDVALARVHETLADTDTAPAAEQPQPAWDAGRDVEVAAEPEVSR